MTTQDNEHRQLIEVKWWPTAAFVAGLGLLYIGERAIGEPAKYRIAADALAGAAILASFFGRFGALGKNTDEKARRVERWLLGAMGVALAGLGLYFLFALGREGLRNSLGKGFDRVDGVVAVLWPALIVAGALPLLLMQRALQSMTDGAGRAEHIEQKRVAYSAQSGLTVALVVVFCFSVNFIAGELNKKYDMARFRSTRPSPATQKIVQTLGKPVKATLFLPATNEVREQIEPYFSDLAQQSKQFTYEVLDHALSPKRAAELAATGNGLVVLYTNDEKGNPASRETVQIGTTLESASAALARFDGDLQKRLLLITRPGRIAYFTTGHGERGFDRLNMDLTREDLRAPISGLQQVLQGQGYEVKTLGVGQGLANKVPGDAGIVFIPGPTEHFLPEEVSALNSYLLGGGHIFLMMDTASETAAADLAPLLKSAGLKFHPDLLCNTENFWPRTHQKSDFANIAATSFSSHASMTTLSRASGRVALILPRSGWFERDGAAPTGMQQDFTIRSMPQTFLDANRNFTFEPTAGEKERTYELAAVAQKTIGDAKDKKELRLVALGSIDAVTDLVLAHRPNLVMALDSIKWLMGDEAIAADVAQEQDMPIVHTKSEDKGWFYLTVFAAPTLILVGGLLYTRRGRRRRAS